MKNKFVKKDQTKKSKTVANDKSTSWDNVSGWYNKLVSSDGHYYHQHVVIPGVLKLIKLKQGDKFLDLACGQGVLARALPQNLNIEYCGVDIAQGLLDFAIKQNKNPKNKFIKADLSQDLNLEKKDFTHAAIILALQDLEFPQVVLQSAAKHLVENGQLIIVINHPHFRIPRQSSWQVDSINKLQCRQVNAYMSPMKIPLQANPSQGEKSKTMWRFHQPLANYMQFLAKAGFVVSNIEEWVSDKESQGKHAKMENRSRAEIPLFMTLVCHKLKTS